MMIPTVHLNGTSRAELLRQYIDAGDAIAAAMQALQRSAPHGRDYYLQGPTAINSAIAEHGARMAKLSEIKDEIMAVAEAVSAHGAR